MNKIKRIQLCLILPKEVAAVVKNLPTLQKILARGHLSKINFDSYAALIFSLFNLPVSNELPISAITGLADKLPTQTDFWLRADPVIFQSDLAAVYLSGNESLQLTVAEQLQYGQLINDFLRSDNLVLHTPNAKRWYIESKQPINLVTYPLDSVIAKNIYNYLPHGTDQNYWRKLFTELQMLLHGSNITQQLAEQGRQAINGIWFWGSGKLPSNVQANWQMVWSDNLLIHGLTQLSKISHQKLPKTFSDCLAAISQPGDYLIELNTLPQQFELDWLFPLMTALRKRKVNKLELFIGNESLYDVSPVDVYKFWKRTY